MLLLSDVFGRKRSYWSSCYLTAGLNSEKKTKQNVGTHTCHQFLVSFISSRVRVFGLHGEARKELPGLGDLTNHLLTVSWHCTAKLPTNNLVQVNIYRDGRVKAWWCDISWDARRWKVACIHCIVLERCFSRTWCSELLLDDVQQTLTGREARLGPGQETMEQ